MVYGLNVQPVYDYTSSGTPLDDGFQGPIPALNPVNDGGTGWSGRNGGVPVDGSNFPKRMRWNDPYGKPVPDFDNSPELNVSERAKAVIEELEPGVHQFFPVDYVDKRDQPLPRRYWFVVCNRIDSLDREHTTMVLRKGKVWRPVSDLVRRGEPIPDHLDPDTESKLVFSLSAIGKAKIWKDKHLDGGGACISDCAAGRFQECGLKGLDFANKRMETV